jgi:hypothetical protein
MVAAIGAVAAVGSAAISANGARSAANSQAASADQASQAQMMAAAQMRADLQPWVQAGGAAQSRLNQYLGLGGVGTSGRTSLGLSTGLTPEQVRQQLQGRYTRQTTTSGGSGAPAAPAYRTGAEAIAALGAAGAHDYFQQQNTQNANTDRSSLWTSPDSSQQGAAPVAAQGPTSTIDEEGLNAAISRYYEEQDAQNRAAEADPTYGSLLRPYRNGEEFDSGPAFSFTGENLASDPGYQFGLNQGTQGIERGQASRGNFLSGAAMKELSRFNEDYAGTKFNDAYNRNLSTYSTNLNRRQNEWNTNLGAYNQNRNTIYNFLTGQSTMGQNSAAQVGTNNQQTANAVGNNIMGAGNVQAAANIAGSNALASGINGAANAYNSTNNLNSAAGWNNLLSRQGGGYSGYTGYTGTTDSIGNMNTQRGWTA